MVETVQISPHQVRVYKVAAEKGGWLSILELASAAKVVRRTAALHAGNFVEIGIFERKQVFPGHRFRLVERPNKRAQAFIKRLEEAETVF